MQTFFDFGLRDGILVTISRFDNSHSYLLCARAGGPHTLLIHSHPPHIESHSPKSILRRPLNNPLPFAFFDSGLQAPGDRNPCQGAGSCFTRFAL